MEFVRMRRLGFLQYRRPADLIRSFPLFRNALIFSLASLIGTLAAKADVGIEESPPSPAAATQQTRILIGFYVNAIRTVDWEQRRFYADVYWWIRYPAPAVSDDEQKQAISRIEAIEFVNADPTDFSQKELERQTIATPHGPEIYVSYRTVAYFYFEADFHRYPFDEQILPIIVEHETLGSDDFNFVDDTEAYERSAVGSSRWGLGSSVAVQDFTVTRALRRVENYRYDTNFGDSTVLTARHNSSFETPRMTLAIQIRRVFTPYLVKIMIPLVICLVLPYLVFFIDACNLEVASGLTVTSLLACVAIQLTVVPGLPDVGYVVTSDVFFYLAYVLAMLAMGQTVWTHAIAESHPKFAQRMDIFGRFAYPAIFVLGFLWIVRA